MFSLLPIHVSVVVIVLARHQDVTLIHQSLSCHHQRKLLWHYRILSLESTSSVVNFTLFTVTYNWITLPSYLLWTWPMVHFTWTLLLSTPCSFLLQKTTLVILQIVFTTFWQDFGCWGPLIMQPFHSKTQTFDLILWLFDSYFDIYSSLKIPWLDFFTLRNSLNSHITLFPFTNTIDFSKLT